MPVCDKQTQQSLETDSEEKTVHQSFAVVLQWQAQALFFDQTRMSHRTRVIFHKSLFNKHCYKLKWSTLICFFRLHMYMYMYSNPCKKCLLSLDNHY